MNRKIVTTRYALVCMMLAAAPRLLAQAAPTQPSTATPVDEAVVELSPFTVNAAEDAGGYVAKNTLAGSRVRTELKDVGSAISVVTTQFLKDTGATNSQTLLKYTTNTEVGGLGGNFAGLGNGGNLNDSGVRMSPHTNTRVRGLSEADNTRDFFLTDIPWDSFNVDRVDLQRGPNAILFGIGKPAGVINNSINAASFKDANKAEFRFGSYGSVRTSGDINKVIMRDELAIRLSAVDDDTKYRQDPTFNRDRRMYGAVRWDPKFLRFEGARTSIKVNYEKGEIEANRPNILPPGDLITPWWTDSTLKGVTINPATIGIGDRATVLKLMAAGDKGAGMRQLSADNPNINYHIGSFGRNYGGIVAAFSDPNSSAFSLINTDASLGKNISGIPWTIMSGVIPMQSYVAYVWKTLKNTDGTLKYANGDFYKNVTLSDPSIFNFYNNSLAGPNNRQWSNHEASNIDLTQTFFHNRLGISAILDHQSYYRAQSDLLSDFGQALTVDFNTHLTDGTKNPNFGRPCVISDQYNNNSYATTRDSYRVTGFGELKGEDFFGKSLLSSIIGRHVFTGLMSGEKCTTETRSWYRYAADATYGVTLNDPLVRNRGVNTLNYLGSSVYGRATIAGAGIEGLKAVQTADSGQLRFFDNTYVSSVNKTDPWTDAFGTVRTQADNPANYKGWTYRGLNVISDPDLLTSAAGLRKTEITSKAGNWQAYLFDGVFVPSVGIRQDRQKSYVLNQGPKNPNGDDLVNVRSPNYKLPSTPDNVISGRTKSYSFVLHTPKKIREKMWANTGLSLFYNRSENFQPSAGRVDFNGDHIASPEGKTKDYGIILTTLDERLTFKINWYETKVANDSLNAIDGQYMVPAGEAWGYMFANAALTRQNFGGWADYTTGYKPKDSSQTQAEAAAIGDAICNAFMANLAPASFYKTWGIDKTQANSWMGWTDPQGLTISGDTKSKGVEYEINAQPTKNWNISINASKTTATRLNMAQSAANFVEGRWKVLNTPVMLNGKEVGVIGDIRFWGGQYQPEETLVGKMGREFMSNYWLYRIQEGADVPELRPWRFNLVSGYNFTTGMLKGVNVGGAYRWQDGVIVGYPVLPGATATSPRAFDMANPYKGPSETNVDAWIGYGHKLTKKVDWRIQLNLRNITSKVKLIPITVQPDGSPAASRIAEGFGWTVTNTFTF